MIARDSGVIHFTCDNCSDDIDTEEDDFTYALAVLKAAGWKVFKEDGEWTHRCPACRSDGGFRAPYKD